MVSDEQPGGATALGDPGPAAPALDVSALDVSALDVPALDVSARAFLAHRRRQRRPRILYAAIVTAVVVALGGLAAVAWSRGEISHVTLRTVATAPAAVTLQPTAPDLHRVWATADTAAIGTPAYNGTVVTHDMHTVRGRNALTGRETWSYTRTDRSVCTAIQVGGVTIAVYRLHGSCEELTGLDSGTGARRWTRTLDEDGAVFDGPASYSVYNGTALLVSSTSVYAINPYGQQDPGDAGLDVWRFHHLGCTIHSAVLGSGGALISQSCHGEICGSVSARYCGNGDQLILRNGGEGTDDKSTTNPEKIIWRRGGTTARPVSAASTISAIDPGSSVLHVLAAATGEASTTLPLRRAAVTVPVVTAVTGATLYWSGGITYALLDGATRFAWRAPTAGPVTAQGSDGATAPVLDSALLVAPGPGGALRLTGADGRVTRRFAVGRPAQGGTVTPFGDGLIVTRPLQPNPGDTAGTEYWR